MNPRDVKSIPIVWTATEEGASLSQPIKVADWRDIGLTIVGTGTVTCYGSKQKNPDDTPVIFTDASTIGNSFVALVIADETTPNTYATTLAVADATKLGEINTNLLTWICLGRNSDGVDAFITHCDNS